MPHSDDYPQCAKLSAKGECPEREKGASPPDFMPAIMGWISPEEQRQRAHDLIEAADEITPTGNGKNRHYNVVKS